MNYRTLNAALDGVIREEPCRGKDVALIALGLRALLSAIGSTPQFREHYIAKGGTVLRLRSMEHLERLSTDLDLSGLSLSPGTADDHRLFAASIGRQATQILRDAYSKGAADVVVRFAEDSLGGRYDDSDPDTVSYVVEVSAVLVPGGKTTHARGKAYKIDLTCDEYLDVDLIEDLRVTSYGIPIDVRAYAPLQSIAEKMRAIIQKHRHFERTQNAGNWVPRHLFDLAPLRRLVTTDDVQRLPELFRRKCACRRIPVDGQTRSLLLDRRLLVVAQHQDRVRADAAWAILQELADSAHVPA